MRMNRQFQIAGKRAHLDGERPFGDQLSRPRSDNPNPKHSFGRGVDDQFGEPIRSIEDRCAAGR
jgi:hypothetical protein